MRFEEVVCGWRRLEKVGRGWNMLEKFLEEVRRGGWRRSLEKVMEGVEDRRR